MRRAGLLLIVCLLPILGTGLAHAADCQFLTSGSWGPFDTYTGTLDCATPQASDSYIVPSGVTVDVIDDILLEGTPGEQISVNAGGTFRIRALARQSGAGRLVLSMNRQGLVCDNGSTCEFEGAFRRNDDLGPALQSDLDSRVHLEAGAILPCPGWNASASSWESDCAAVLQGPSDLPGSPYEVGFHYVDLAATAPAMNAAFAALEVREILCFYDANRDDPLAPVDDGFCYEIVWVSHDGSRPGDASAMIKIERVKPRFAIPSEDFFGGILQELFARREEQVQQVVQRGRDRVLPAAALGKLSKKIKNKPVYMLTPREFGEITRVMWEVVN